MAQLKTQGAFLFFLFSFLFFLLFFVLLHGAHSLGPAIMASFMLSFSQGNGSHPGRGDNGSVCLYLAFIPFVSECRISLWFVWAFQKAYLLIQRGARLMAWRMQAKFICAWKYTIVSRHIGCLEPMSRLIWLLCVLSCSLPKKKWLLTQAKTSAHLSLLCGENRARNSDQDNGWTLNDDHLSNYDPVYVLVGACNHLLV